MNLAARSARKHVRSHGTRDQQAIRHSATPLQTYNNYKERSRLSRSPLCMDIPLRRLNDHCTANRCGTHLEAKTHAQRLRSDYCGGALVKTSVLDKSTLVQQPHGTAGRPPNQAATWIRYTRPCTYPGQPVWENCHPATRGLPGQELCNHFTVGAERWSKGKSLEGLVTTSPWRDLRLQCNAHAERAHKHHLMSLMSP